MKEEAAKAAASKHGNVSSNWQAAGVWRSVAKNKQHRASIAKNGHINTLYQNIVAPHRGQQKRHQ